MIGNGQKESANTSNVITPTIMRPVPRGSMSSG